MKSELAEILAELEALTERVRRRVANDHHVASPASPESAIDIASDGSWLCWGRQEFTFGPQAARCVLALVDQYRSNPAVPLAASALSIAAFANSSADWRIGKVFRRHRFGRFIEQVTRGFYRLRPPRDDAESPQIPPSGPPTKQGAPRINTSCRGNPNKPNSPPPGTKPRRNGRATLGAAGNDS